MKKIIMLLSLSLSAGAFAAGYGAAGCGLGSMVFGNQKGLIQVFAATTNGTSGSQTFGITSGTSNCESGSKKATQFISVNKASLTNEAAIGYGESLAALSEIYGCGNAEQFNSTLKSKFEAIFNTQDALEIHQNIMKTIQSENIQCRELV